MAQDSFRRSHLTLPLFGPLAVAATVATFLVDRHQRLAAVQLTLTDSGVGAGQTSIAVKINGNDVTPAGLAVAGAAPVPAIGGKVIGGVQGFPNGAALEPGDVITIDVTAVPATTAPKGGAVVLDLVQLDV